MILLVTAVFAAAPAPQPVYPAGFVPAVLHVTTNPLLPQKYRSVPAGEYHCTVDIALSAEGKVIDVTPTDCDQESFWALTTAIIEWDFDPATQDGAAVASTLAYTGVFEVRTLLPRKHVVGFVGVVGSVGGAGVAGVDGRIHLGERVSLSGGVEFNRDELEASLVDVWTPVFHADVAVSSPRQSFEHRGNLRPRGGRVRQSVGGVGPVRRLPGRGDDPHPRALLGR